MDYALALPDCLRPSGYEQVTGHRAQRWIDPSCAKDQAGI
jgi:hypothetical protein